MSAQPEAPAELAAGPAMHDLVARLYPICRSITGAGVRETLRILQEYVPLTLHEVPSGTPVFDWVVPDEWNIHDAYIKNSRGERVVDFRRSNLHVLNYSIPVQRMLTLDELRPHLFTSPEHPDWVPYRTSYYQRQWGFCLSQRQLDALPDDTYEVCIDATLAPGHLSYGEYVLPGTSDDEILISCHVCHPSLCNDNLSGVAVAAWLARSLQNAPRRYTYRFVFIPATIGAITWLCLNEARTPAIKHGLVLTCVGDAGGFTYKQSRREDATIDRAVAHVLEHSGTPYTLRPFSPLGYDERQYCSPGFNLPVGCFMRTPNGCYPEYHSSADNLDLVRPEALAGSLVALRQVMDVLEHDDVFVSQNPKCEPQLGRRGLYAAVGGLATVPNYQQAIMWVLNLADGQHTLLEMAERAAMPFSTLHAAALHLETHGLVARACVEPLG